MNFRAVLRARRCARGRHALDCHNKMEPSILTGVPVAVAKACRCRWCGYESRELTPAGMQQREWQAVIDAGGEVVSSLPYTGQG